MPGTLPEGAGWRFFVACRRLLRRCCVRKLSNFQHALPIGPPGAGPGASVKIHDLHSRATTETCACGAVSEPL